MGHYDDLYEADRQKELERQDALIEKALEHFTAGIQILIMLPTSKALAVAITQVQTGVLWVKSA